MAADAEAGWAEMGRAPLLSHSSRARVARRALCLAATALALGCIALHGVRLDGLGASSAGRGASSAAAGGQMVHQSVEGWMQQGTDFAQHLGGFCFGHNPSVSGAMPVAWVWLRLRRTGTAPWQGRGRLLWLYFDDEPQHWPAALANWNSSTLHEKLEHASGFMELLPFSSSREEDLYRIHIIQHSGSRHWHFALVAVGLHFYSNASLGYNLTGFNGLSTWSAGEMQPSECPGDLTSDFAQSLWHLVAA
mmetsp:Transcript_48806/g.109783  ORF Transcript_48806/g.109783 Transcript_48806/m.109783 type:complete len:249 (-) Transcript_48806:55-801(-)